MKRYQKLAWDTEFFGRPIGKVEGSTLSDAEARAVVEDAKKDGIDALYFLAAGSDSASWAAAVRHGFVPVDVKIGFDQDLVDKPPAVPGIRAAREADRPAILELTRGMFTGSRFYSDPHFTRASCDGLYQAWMAKALANPAVGTLVLEDEGSVAGYVTCEGNRIGLIGIRPSGRGKGIAGKLVAASLGWFHQHGVKNVEVATQGNNIAAQRVYQKHGFRTKTLELWLHWWRTP